ncbi:MAG: hypothetical protein HYU73_14665, partial [Betaproteobacteria bacterium]|nr:hypothetical protein [Betaproteobacteria bacterium]
MTMSLAHSACTSIASKYGCQAAVRDGDSPSITSEVNMETREWKIVGPWAAFVFYLAIALEVVVMVTPFTAYFYSIYAPVLNWLESNPLTAWLTAFFLPHISYTGDPILTALAYLGPILFGLGLVIFFVCAYQVYSAK